MRVIAMALLFWSSIAMAIPKLTLGAGLEGRMSPEVNTESRATDGVAQVYTSIRFEQPWSLLLEVSRGSNKSALGNYSVERVSIDTLVAGRYEIRRFKYFSPFIGAGLGWNFKNITTKFGSARDERWSNGGGLATIGLGATATYYEHWNIELEYRMAKYEMLNEPVWSGIVRSGYTF